MTLVYLFYFEYISSKTQVLYAKIAPLSAFISGAIWLMILKYAITIYVI